MNLGKYVGTFLYVVGLLTFGIGVLFFIPSAIITSIGEWLIEKSNESY